MPALRLRLRLRLPRSRLRAIATTAALGTQSRCLPVARNVRGECSDHTDVPDERTMLHTVCRWATAHRNASLLDLLLPELRLHYISPEELVRATAPQVTPNG